MNVVLYEYLILAIPAHTRTGKCGFCIKYDVMADYAALMCCARCTWSITRILSMSSVELGKCGMLSEKSSRHFVVKVLSRASDL